MGLETGSYVADLTTTNPTATDAKSQGDDHLRLIKTVLKNTFAGFPGLSVVTGSEAQGATTNDYVVTVSPAPAAYTSSFFIGFKSTHANSGAVTLKINSLTAKTLKTVGGAALASGDIGNGDIVVAFYDGTDFFLVSGNDRVNRNGDTYTGTHDFSGATAVSFPAGTTGVTATAGDNSTKYATTAYVINQAFSAALPSQTGNAGKVVTTNGTSASWSLIGEANQLIRVNAEGTALEGTLIGTALQYLRVNAAGTALEGAAVDTSVFSDATYWMGI